MRQGKPTLGEIQDVIPQLETLHQPLWSKFDDDEKFYELEFQGELGIPKEFKGEGIVLPTARDMVDTFVDHIDISNARVFVNKKGAFKISEDESEMMRKFYLGLIHIWNVESDIMPSRIAAKHYALHGLCVFKTMWDADLWPDKPERKENESDTGYEGRIDDWQHKNEIAMPIILRAVHPRHIIASSLAGERLFVIERRKQLCFDAMKKWPHWGNPMGKEMSQEVVCDSYFDDTYRCEMVDGEPILKIRGGVVKHNYGFLPYVFIDSGLGNQSVEADPEMRYVGMLRYMYGLLKAESRDFSIADIILGREAWGGGYLTGDNAKKVQKLTKKYGVYEALPEGVEVKEWGRVVPPDMLNMHLARTSDYISSHAAPRSVRGLSEAGVRSGADRRLIIAEASSRYQYSKDAFRNGFAKVLTNCAKLYKNVIPGDVRVWARGATPADEFDEVIKKDKMREPFTCYVEFSPISEEDEYRRHDDLIRLTGGGIVTQNWARTQMSNVDPQAMELEEEKEKIKNDPNLQQLVSQYAGAKLAQAIAKRGEAEMLVEGGMAPPSPPEAGGEVGRGLVPPIPQRAPIGSGEEMQRKLAALRSQMGMSATQGRGGGGNR